ncbi:MAG: hypothetical protein HPY68_10600 [Candidatus Atribacteria bacterium]|nr:hypothetical protein [Candidatus Atribacteria bacterium]
MSFFFIIACRDFSFVSFQFRFGKASAVLIITLWLVIGFNVLLNSVRIEEG